MQFFSTVLVRSCVESTVLRSPGGIGGDCGSGKASETRRVPRGRVSHLENYWCGYCGCWGRLVWRRGGASRAAWSSPHPNRDRWVCPSADKRVDCAGRRHRSGFEREHLRRHYLSRLADQNDDPVLDLRGTEHGSITARSVSPGQCRSGEQVAD